MVRCARIVAADYFYHITQRGNNRQIIFCDDDDRRAYLSWIDEYSRRYSLELFAYCLMSNHVHFIAKPKEDDSLARTFNTAHMRYAQYFNKKYHSCGHVWQGRFFSSLLDEKYFQVAVRYVEQNPVRARMVEKAWDWPWSSARPHVFGEHSRIKLVDIKVFINVASWQEYLDNKEDVQFLKAIRQQTKAGRILASKEFIERLEDVFQKKLCPAARGRPSKTGK